MPLHDADGQKRFFFALVDDERRIHDFLVSVLQEHGLLRKHVSFYDPLGFIEFLHTTDEEPDIILLDINFENAGLSGVDIIPHIREDFPYLPIILLTGMDNDAIREAQDYQCTYFIPKPVSPEQLARMVRFYMGKSKKTSQFIQSLTTNLEEYKEYQKLLEEEIESLHAKVETDGADEDHAEHTAKKEKAFKRISDLLTGILQNSEAMPSFLKDLEGIFNSQYDLFKKVMEVLIRFDVDISSPGLNIHKVQGTEHVFSARLSKKVRLYFYLGPSTSKRRLLRLDTTHDTKYMDRWIRDNASTYTN
ncbi:MAG: response regulator [Desulfovibrionaceae bacterium]